jgi:hypothetical protein
VKTSALNTGGERTWPPLHGVSTAGGGNYLRSDEGRWVYAFEFLRGVPVPGARDVTLADLANVVEDGDAVAIKAASMLAYRAELGWVSQYPHTQIRHEGRLADVHRVPTVKWRAVADVVVDMIAPELHVSRLLDVPGVERLLVLPAQSLRSTAYPRRYQPFPAPVIALRGHRELYATPPMVAWAAHFDLGGRGR